MILSRDDQPKANLSNILINYFAITDEVRRLESTVASLMEEAGQKAKAEVNKIKDDYNANIKKLSQEVAQLEMVSFV